MKIAVKTLMAVVGGTASGRFDPEAVVDTAKLSFDTRTMEGGEIFFAFSTARHDGAKNIGEAFDKGAVLALATHNPDGLEPVILVEDTLRALQALGRYVRAQYKGYVVGITGSSGKTTSKDLVAHMLSHFGKTSFSQGSFNNHIGTPYSLCKLDLEAPYAVFELGMAGAGEISALVDLVRPNLAAVVNVFPMHMAFFKEFRDIAKAKAEIFEGAVPFHGRMTAVINADTAFADEVLLPEAQKRGLEVVTFGKKGHVRLKDFAVTEALKTNVDLEIDGRAYHGVSQGFGERFAYNVTFAAAVAEAMGLDVAEALDAIADHVPSTGRGTISKVALEDGFVITLIDDSYSAQPAAMHYAVSTLASLPKNGARKVAVLGNMVEIGDTFEQEHHALGKVLSASDVDVVIGVGTDTRHMLEEIPDTVTKIYKETIDGLYDELRQSILHPQDIVLIKGAHFSSRVHELAATFLKKTG